jgi:hypothetical protein
VETTEVIYLEVKLEVQYKIYGRYIPATLYDPAEYLEADIQKVLAGDVDIIDILTDKQLDDIYILLNDTLEL